MQFDSLSFLVFFLVFLFLYVLFQGKLRFQNYLILSGSYLFYGWWDWRFLFLLSLTVIVDFLVAKQLAADRGRAKLYVTASIVFNLGILAIFKYFNFFADSASALLDIIGVQNQYVALNIVLPVGISFYTFQSMSYVIDVYRKQLAPCNSIFDYAAYVSFFPQLIAGPIERGSRLLPQILNPRRLNVERFYEGSYLVFWGLFKKIYIADNLAKIVDETFGGGGDFTNSVQVTIAVYAFAFQIYCDFSAYSDIARGLAKIVGFDLMINFDLPYFATNPAEFWRRWHISLSTWLRDYLYIPLGGSKHGAFLTYRNLMITMLLGGLWHGAQLTFIVWGLYQGVLLVLHRLYRKQIPKLEFLPGWRSLFLRSFKVLVFFQFVCFGWLIFRADDLSQVSKALGAIFSVPEWQQIPGLAAQPVFYLLPLLLVQMLQAVTGKHNAILSLHVIPRTLFYVSLVFLVVFLGNFDANQFIYFQF